MSHSALVRRLMGSRSREGFEFVTLTVEQYSSLSCLDACPGALV